MEVTAGQLHSLYQTTVGAGTGNNKTGVLHLLTELVVELVAVAVALPDLGLAVALGHLGAGHHLAGYLPRRMSAALRNVALLVGHQGDHIMLAIRGEFAGICILVAQNAPGKLHHHDLHAKADAKVGNMILAGILCSLDHAPQCRGRQSRRVR